MTPPLPPPSSARPAASATTSTTSPEAATLAASVSSTIHTRGVGTQQAPTPATRPPLAAALLTDTLVALAAWFTALWIWGLAPFVRLPQLASLALWLAVYFGAQRLTRGLTLGQWAWGLEVSRDRNRLLDLSSGAPLALRPGGILLALFSAAILTLSLWNAALQHPLWADAPRQELEASLPTGPDWQVSPYYYALGAWPVRFEGKPVFLDFPYNPGPPQVFAGRVIARWSTPNISLTFEGPKTPPRLAALSNSRTEVRACLTGQASALNCVSIRNDALGRHVEEMSRLGARREIARDWTLRWLTVRQPAPIPAVEQPQGFEISACATHACETRFVLISPKGMHQAFILRGEAPANGALSQPGPRREQWLGARATFEKSLQSLRVSDDLNYGRAWIDRQIEGTRLRETLALPDRQAVIQRLAETEAILLSKISVEPSVYESYYFLAQLGLTLGRLAARDPQASALEDWPSVARPLTMAAARYAKDVAGQNKAYEKRNAELDAIVVEIQKY